MIESFLKLIDRIIALIQAGEQRRARHFETIVEPLFNAAEPVALDYYRLLDEAACFAHQQDDIHGADIVAQLQTLREQSLLGRRKVTSLAETAAEHCHDRDLNRFCATILRLFAPPRIQPVRKISGPAHIVDFFRELERGDLTTAQVREAVCVAKLRLEDDWSAVCQSYARLKLRNKAGIRTKNDQGQHSPPAYPEGREDAPSRSAEA